MRLVFNVEPHIKTSRQFSGVSHRHQNLFGRPQFQCLKSQLGSTNSGIDHIRHDGRGSGHRASALTVKEYRPHAVAQHRNRVVVRGDFGQWRSDRHQHRRDDQLDPFFRQFTKGNLFDSVANLFRVRDVGQIEVVDPSSIDRLPIGSDSKRQLGQDRQLLSCVASVDIHRRVGFGKTQLLSRPDALAVFDSFAIHSRNNVVRRAVKDPTNRSDLICGQALPDIGYDRNPAGDASFEGDRSPQLSRSLKQFWAMGG